MNGIALIFAVGFCFAVGQALQCYKCKIGLFDLCYTTKTMCADGEHCFSGEGVSGKLKIKTKGCLKQVDCNNTENVNFPSESTTIYSMTKTCCKTDLCNAAPGLPGASVLSLAVVTIFSFLLANVIV